MNEEIYDLAAQSGATDEKGCSVKNSDVICFTKTEFEGFIERLINYQTAHIQRRFDQHLKYTGVIVSADDLLDELKRKIMGVN